MFRGVHPCLCGECAGNGQRGCDTEHAADHDRSRIRPIRGWLVQPRAVVHRHVRNAETVQNGGRCRGGHIFLLFFVWFRRTIRTGRRSAANCMRWPASAERRRAPRSAGSVRVVGVPVRGRFGDGVKKKTVPRHAQHVSDGHLKSQQGRQTRPGGTDQGKESQAASACGCVRWSLQIHVVSLAPGAARVAGQGGVRIHRQRQLCDGPTRCQVGDGHRFVVGYVVPQRQFGQIRQRGEGICQRRNVRRRQFGVEDCGRTLPRGTVRTGYKSSAEPGCGGRSKEVCRGCGSATVPTVGRTDASETMRIAAPMRAV